MTELSFNLIWKFCFHHLLLLSPSFSSQYLFPALNHMSTGFLLLSYVNCLNLLRLVVPSTTSCNRQFLQRICPIQVAVIWWIVVRLDHSSSTLKTSTFDILSVQLEKLIILFSPLAQQSKLFYFS